MAEEAAKTEAAPAKRSSSTFVMIAAFMFVLLIMFDNNLRLLTGRIVGFAFNPVVRLWNFDPLWTILFAGVVMILATTVIRHFLVDWVHMAKVQEVMRTFQKEFSAARKSNNTYQMKRLTDMQPEVMKMQADMSTEQMKPMAFTMLLVIPIFAWLSTLTGAGVVYAPGFSADATDTILVAVTPDVQDAFLLEPGGRDLTLLRGANLFTIALPGTSPTGTVSFSHPRSDHVETLDLSKSATADWAALKVATLEPGAYAFRPEGDESISYTIGDDAHSTRSHVLVIVPTGGGDPQVLFVNGGGVVTHNAEGVPVGRLETPVDIAVASDVYALVPFEEGRSPTGALKEKVYRADNLDDEIATWDLPVEKHAVLVDADATQARAIPHSAVLPWNAESDLNGAWGFLPHWILLYSLFSIPFGQITQKLLKLWEYSKVDLDQDGKAPGLSV